MTTTRPLPLHRERLLRAMLDERCIQTVVKHEVNDDIVRGLLATIDALRAEITRPRTRNS